MRNNLISVFCWSLYDNDQRPLHLAASRATDESYPVSEVSMSKDYYDGLLATAKITEWESRKKVINVASFDSMPI